MQTGALFAAGNAQPVLIGRYLLDWFRIVPRIDFNSQGYSPVKWPEYQDQDLAAPAGRKHRGQGARLAHGVTGLHCDAVVGRTVWMNRAPQPQAVLRHHQR
jgi:hypothetical protein